MNKIVNLERLKQSLVDGFGKALKAVDEYLQKAVFNREIKSLNAREIKQLTANADKELQGLFGVYMVGLKSNWRSLFVHRYRVHHDEAYQAYQEIRQRLNMPKSLMAYADEVFDKPLNITANVGITLNDLTKSFSKTESERIIRAIRLAHSESLTNDKLIQMIRGSRANNFKDGILATTTRNAQTIARTGTAIMASEAKQEFINQNRDVIKGIRVNATLDRRTCLVAGTLIDTPSGQRPIEEITVGDSVIGGSGQVKTVSGTLRSKTNKLCKITLSDGRSIICTPDHRWWTSIGWVDAECLVVGDILPRNL